MAFIFFFFFPPFIFINCLIITGLSLLPPQDSSTPAEGLRAGKLMLVHWNFLHPAFNTAVTHRNDTEFYLWNPSFGSLKTDPKVRITQKTC